jgi:TPR repeat protein
MQRIDDVSNRISYAYGLPKPLLFVSKQGSPNAYVTISKDGPIMVFGIEMLRLVGDDDDLMAAVVGHEFGHLKADHLTSGRTTKEVIGFLGQLVGLALDIDQAKKGVDTQGLGFELGKMGAGLVNSKFSRDQEREADDLGIDKMARAGFDPSAAAKLWQLMEQQGGGGSGLWFSSHPSSTERRQSLLSAASKLDSVYLANKSTSVLTAKVAPPSIFSRLDAANTAERNGDYKTALANILPVAESGNALGQLRLGYFYSVGRGVEKDSVQAVSWYRKSADQGNATAMGNLGNAYSFGRGVEKDESQSVKWYRSAIDAGHIRSLAQLGVMYEAGRGLPKSEEEALKLYRQAVEKNDPFGQYRLGLMYVTGRGGLVKDEAEAVKLYQAAAEQNYLPAVHQLAIVYSAGRGVTKDENEAHRLFLKAAEAGYAPAQLSVGNSYARGRMVEKSEAQAVSWYKKAADQQFPPAQEALGKAYRDGVGTNKDLTESLKWFRSAAELGFKPAQREVGDIYMFGRGVAKDEVEAKKWYQMDVVSNGTSSPPSFNVTSSNEVLTSNPKPIQNNAGAKSVEQRLFELKSLMDKGLITSAQFEQKRIEILNSL